MTAKALQMLGLAAAFSAAAATAAAATIGETKLTAPLPGVGDNFGIGVGIDAETGIIGVSQDDDAATNAGSAYLVDIASGALGAQLTASDAGSFDLFGISVGVSDGVAVVGASNPTGQGAAYLFDTATAAELRKLTASDAEDYDQFGGAVAIDGDTVIVGAAHDDDAGSRSGSAYVFSAATGAELAKLTADDAAGGDEFGGAVDVSGTIAVVGARGDDDAGASSGAAYLFDVATGNQLRKLTADDADASGFFGISVAIDGDLVLVGALGDDENGVDSGAAYLFDAVTGAQLAKLTAPDGAAGAYFGASVALSGETAMIGAYGDDDGRGAVYLFDTVTGLLVTKITASDGEASDNFGLPVALGDGAALVGAYGDVVTGDFAGAAYLLKEAAAVPLPAGLWLLGGGLLALVALRRRGRYPASISRSFAA